MSSASMPLHLLPPHIKLHILQSLHTQPTQPPAHRYSSSDTNDKSIARQPIASFTSISATIPISSSARSVTSAPLFVLASLTATTPLPPPFTIETLAHLHNHGYCTIDAFLPPPTTPPLHALQADIDHLDATGAFTQGGMQAGESWKAVDVRGDRVCWLSNDRPNPHSVSHVLAALHNAVAELAAVLDGWPGVASSSQLAVYETGGRYVRHLDVRRGGGGPVRRLTAIVYLNEGWQSDWGGQLRLYGRCGIVAGEESETSVDVFPVYGRLLLFASEEVEHEVLPATHRRVAITTWFK